jgi:hypothetical protein
VAGLAVGGLAIAFAEITDESSSLVLFSGQEALGPFLHDASTYSAATLLWLLVGKALAYATSLGSFRGGPIFPALFVGAVGGVAASHLPGLDPVAGAAMGMGAMTVVMLGFPLTAVLIATVLLGTDGFDVIPLVIISTAVAFVAAERLRPAPDAADAQATSSTSTENSAVNDPPGGTTS